MRLGRQKARSSIRESSRQPSEYRNDRALIGTVSGRAWTTGWSPKWRWPKGWSWGIWLLRGRHNPPRISGIF
jgi:hypothetical protein